MSDRRVFLKMLGVSAVSFGCGSSGSDTSGGGGQGGTSDASSTADTGVGGFGGAGGAGGMTASSSSTGGSTCPLPGTSAGLAADFSANGLHKVKSTGFLVGHDSGGFYAMSSICTHKFCNMNSAGVINAAGIKCVCHGSRFDDNGNVTAGPAINPLKHFQLAITCDGYIYVDTTQIVDAATRVMG